MTPIIVPTYAAILVLIFVFLSARVIQMRNSEKIVLGSGGNLTLERRIRVHGNFAEYVPFAILLLAFMEIQQHSRYVIHILCLVLVVARVIHAFGVTPIQDNLPMRVAGAALTFLVLVAAALALLINGLRAGLM
jgi:uncharacterized membrane protein YecN with MAPEG domain